MAEESISDYGGDGVDYSGRFVTTQLFADLDDACDWACGVALECNFILTRSSYKPTCDGRPVLYLKCDRSKRFVFRDLEAAKRKNTKRKSCKCPFRIKVQCRRDDGGWEIIAMEGVPGTHNHPLIVYEEGHRQISHLTPQLKVLVKEMSVAQARPCNIMAALKQKFPNEHPNIRYIYNERSTLRVKAVDGRDVVQQFIHLAREHNYVTYIGIDPDTRAVTHVFLAHPGMAQLLRMYPYVIGMDCTYKTNSYGMPFLEIVGVTPTNKNFLIGYVLMRDESYEKYKWVLEKLKMYLGVGVSPTIFLTDQELGLLKALNEVFPDVKHLLCHWHINKDVLAKVKTLLGGNLEAAKIWVKDKWRHVVNAKIAQRYEQCVGFMADTTSNGTIIQYLQQTWLPYHEKFVRAWTDDVMHFGNTSTCRVESQHSVLKQWLGGLRGKLDTVFSRVHSASEGMLIEIKTTLEDCRRRTVSQQWVMPFRQLCSHISFYAFDILRKEYVWMRSQSDEVYEECGCVKQRTHGLPCVCVMAMAEEGRTRLYLNQIHPFWRTLVIGDGDEAQIFAKRSEADVSEFGSLVDDVLDRDPSFIRDMNQVLHDHLFQEQSQFKEPETNERQGGRPPGAGRQWPSGC